MMQYMRIGYRMRSNEEICHLLLEQDMVRFIMPLMIGMAGSHKMNGYWNNAKETIV